MGLFSRFRKRKQDNVDEDEAYARLAANSELQRQDDAADRDLQRDIARATVLKIDAIEAAMTADMFAGDEQPFRRTRPPRPAASATDGPPTALLDEDDVPADVAQAEGAAAVEEAAILYAQGQEDAAGELLRAAIARAPLGERTAWWMLFDLYQVQGHQEAFDSLAIDYASTFETSPPQWNGLLAEATPAYSGVTPTAALAGVLDGAAARQIARIGDAADGAAILRLDFSRVLAVEPEGCALLVDALRIVQRGRELILVGAAELLAQVREIVEVGRRDGGEAPWLLLLELLRLQGREKEFEEASMDYCVTFEVSPPPYVAPGRVASEPRQPAGPAGDRYLLPRTIEGEAADVLARIRAYADRSPSLVFDCSRLARIEYGAATALLALLNELAADGRRVELRELNHLAAALLGLLGGGGAVRLTPYRY